MSQGAWPESVFFRYFHLRFTFESIKELWSALVIVGGTKVLHDVGSFLLFPFMELGILQESPKASGFANYSFQKIANTFSFADEASHSELVL